MHNHQIELAEAMSKSGINPDSMPYLLTVHYFIVFYQGYCASCSPSNLLESLLKLDGLSFIPYPNPNKNIFPGIVDDLMGWTE